MSVSIVAIGPYMPTIITISAIFNAHMSAQASKYASYARKRHMSLRPYKLQHFNNQ